MPKWFNLPSRTESSWNNLNRNNRLYRREWYGRSVGAGVELIIAYENVIYRARAVGTKQ
jgi:hypothetical protein